MKSPGKIRVKKKKKDKEKEEAKIPLRPFQAPP